MRRVTPRRPLLALALPALLTSLLAPASASAEPGLAPFAPMHEQQLVGLDDFSFDSDWFPMNAPLQLRLIVHGGNTVKISMPGQGRYDWDSETIDFLGDPDAGHLGLDIGLTLDAKIRFDVLGLQWESDIIGPYDYAVIAEDGFTPYLLPGNPERPVTIDDETDPVTFVSVPVTPDIIVAAGNLDIDAYVIVAAALAGDSIEAVTLDPMAQLATVTAEGEAVSLLAGPGPLPDPLEVDGTLVCELSTDVTIVLKPTLVMEILGQKFEIADIEIPIELPPFADILRLGPVAMSFPRARDRHQRRRQPRLLEQRQRQRRRAPDLRRPRPRSHRHRRHQRHRPRQRRGRRRSPARRRGLRLHQHARARQPAAPRARVRLPPRSPTSRATRTTTVIAAACYDGPLS